MGVGCLAKTGHEGWLPLPLAKFLAANHAIAEARAPRKTNTTMPPASKKNTTREALMDAFLVLNSLILLFSHWAAPRK
jgi:hypothetical protein